MERAEKQVVLNRAVFTRSSFESGSLTVLTSLFHRFPRTGRYRAHVQHASRPLRDLTVVVDEASSRLQANLDLSNLDDERGCCCDDEGNVDLAVNGVVGFYPSTGVGGYRVVVTDVTTRAEQAEGGHEVVLDNEKGVPAGDYFAVVLTRPGSYVLAARNARTELKVTLPQRERLRTDEPTLVVLNSDGFTPRSLNLLAGRALVIQCDIDAELRLELVQAEDGEEPERPRRRTYRRARPKEG